MHIKSSVDKIEKTLHFLRRFVGRYFEEDRFTPLSVPTLTVEVTNVCNSKCVFCANSKMKRPRYHMDTELFRKSINDFASIEGRNVDFNGCIGEPLLDSYLLEKVRYVHQFQNLNFRGFYTTLQSLHNFNINEFFESGIFNLSISTALSGRTKYNEFFGIDAYEQMKKNLILLLEENKKQNNPIEINYTIMRTNESIENIINHPDFKLVNELSDGKLLKAIKSRGEFVDDWVGYVKLPSYLKKRPCYPRFFRPCRFFYDKLIVFQNGRVGMCPCRDFEASSELILGNIREISLGDLWNRDKINGLRERWRKKNIIPSICRHCSHYNY